MNLCEGQFIYLIQVEKYFNTNIYKIGRTIRNPFTRFKEYTGKIKIIQINFVINAITAENNLRNEFKKKFNNPVIGREYFEGDLIIMIEIFNKVVKELINLDKDVFIDKLQYSYQEEEESEEEESEEEDEEKIHEILSQIPVDKFGNPLFFLNTTESRKKYKKKAKRCLPPGRTFCKYKRSINKGKYWKSCKNLATHGDYCNIHRNNKINMT